jgi:hypothetical protein
VTDRPYTPGVINIDAIAQGGLTFRHGGLVAVGTTNRMMVAFVGGMFGYALPPKLTVLALSLNPVPVIVTRVPTGPVSGWRDMIVGAEEGETLLLELQAILITAATHAQSAVLLCSTAPGHHSAE